MIILWGNLAGNILQTRYWITALSSAIFGFPEMGIRGAGLATALTGAIPVIYWRFCFFPDSTSGVQDPRRLCLDKELFLKLVRYGVPSGSSFSWMCRP